MNNTFKNFSGINPTVTLNRATTFPKPDMLTIPKKQRDAIKSQTSIRRNKENVRVSDSIKKFSLLTQNNPYSEKRIDKVAAKNY